AAGSRTSNAEPTIARANAVKDSAWGVAPETIQYARRGWAQTGSSSAATTASAVALLRTEDRRRNRLHPCMAHLVSERDRRDDERVRRFGIPVMRRLHAHDPLAGD